MSTVSTVFTKLQIIPGYLNIHRQNACGIIRTTVIVGNHSSCDSIRIVREPRYDRAALFRSQLSLLQEAEYVGLTVQLLWESEMLVSRRDAHLLNTIMGDSAVESDVRIWIFEPSKI